MTKTTAVLFLDVEGGWGGSSRSLYYLVKYLARDNLLPIVVLRKDGPVKEHYKKLGITCLIAPEMASFRPADRKNFVAFTLYLWSMRKYFSFRKKIKMLVKEYNIGLIHVNHESLSLTGSLVAWELGLPWVAHVRTLLTPGWFAKLVYKIIANYSSHTIFITEPNLNHFKSLVGSSFNMIKTSIIYNITPESFKDSALQEMEGSENKFRVLSLTNFAPSRGVDRIIDIATELKNRGESDFLFYLYGKSSHSSVITGRPDKYFENLKQRVKTLGLTSNVFFMGHTIYPEKALAGCDVLLKLTRQSNPWGRDIMEALAAGVPIITLGKFTEFVENGVNGYINADYNVDDIVDELVKLSNSKELCSIISNANRQKARALFNGEDCSQEVRHIYSKVIKDQN
ncbi:MAG: hypothetical protein CMM30_02795 [Rhodospirillaceae bacterium]|nr:hypothetical protein [Alphaproteobacteria bacterium]MBR71853.1 hypothetical protein [Rhodospirillaceae bacterium]